MPKPSLRLIQDVLKNADGSVSSGSLEISWAAGTSPDGYTIAAGRLRVFLVNGAISVSLVPGTYHVKYQGALGAWQTETWVVPSSPGPFTIAQLKQ